MVQVVQLLQESKDVKVDVEDLPVYVGPLLSGIMEVKKDLGDEIILVLVICMSSEKRNFIDVVVDPFTVISC